MVLPWYFSAYGARYVLLWPARQAVRVLGLALSKVPGTTYGEIAEMHDGPCSRCVGRALREGPFGS